VPRDLGGGGAGAAASLLAGQRAGAPQRHAPGTLLAAGVIEREHLSLSTGPGVHTVQRSTALGPSLKEIADAAAADAERQAIRQALQACEGTRPKRRGACAPTTRPPPQAQAARDQRPAFKKIRAS